MPAKSPCAIVLRSCPRQPEYCVAKTLGEMPLGGDSTAAAGAASARAPAAASASVLSFIAPPFRRRPPPGSGMIAVARLVARLAASARTRLSLRRELATPPTDLRKRGGTSKIGSFDGVPKTGRSGVLLCRRTCARVWPARLMWPDHRDH